MGDGPRWKIVGLEGRYCNNCVKSLVDFRAKRYEILPMCNDDLDQFLHNGDVQRIQKMMEEKHESNGT